MKRFQRQTFTRFAACVALIVGMVSPAVADTVWTLSSGVGAKPFERTKMKIEGLSEKGLLIRSVSQDRAAEPKPLKEIWRVQVDDEAALNAAEIAFVEEKWDEAIAGYQRTLNTSRKDWVKQYATSRLVRAAEKTRTFSSAAIAYVALVSRSPNAAAKLKPDVPQNAKGEVTAAITTVKNALADPRITSAQKTPLQAFLAELYLANGQSKEAEALGANLPAPTAPPANKTADRKTTLAPAKPSEAKVDLQLQLATAAVKQKKFQEALDTINAIGPSVNEPADRARALFTLAEAEEGLAGSDPGKLKDAALAYMRVVAHFKNEPDAPFVAESLYKCGVALEAAKLLPDALTAYKAVGAEFKDSPHARDAAASAARVQKAIEETKG